MEKTTILARLSQLRAHAPGLFWGGIATAGLSLFGMVAAVATIPGPDATTLNQRVVIDNLVLTPSTEVLEADAAFFREDQIRRDDTLSSLLERMGLTDDEAIGYLRNAPEAREVMRRLIPGKTVYLSTTAFGQLLSLELPGSNGDHVLRLERRSGKLELHDEALAYEVRQQAKAATIRSSLFGATDEAGLPDSVAVSLAEIFSHQIDFHRDLRRGDHFRVVYEVMQHRGMPVRAGRVLAAEFVNDGQRYTAVWNASPDGRGDYYTADGKPLKRGFLRSPLEFSRVTSGMGMRFHPILKTWRQHKGVDYGAPIGTRVRAVADGVVAFAGVQNGYGNIVVLRHAGGVDTAYAHLSRIGVRVGQHVQQSDTVGAVGMTGAATGPHLHYEYRVGGEVRDPLKVILPEAPPLAGAALGNFLARTQPLMQRLREAEAPQLAQN